MTPSDTSLRCIKRNGPDIAHGRRAVWIVTIVRNQVRVGARFHDEAYPNPVMALEAARAFRDAIEARLPDRRGGRAINATADDTTFVRRAVFGGKASWMIRMRIHGKLRAKLFSVRKYGEVEARRLALAERPQWLRDAGLDASAHPALSKSEIEGIERKIRLDFGEINKAKSTRGYNDAQLYGISRSELNSLGQDGVWTVMIMRRKVRHGGRFSDREYGGMEAALKMAQACRDDILATVAPLTRRERAEMLLVTNKSGVTGVRLEMDKRGNPYAWAAEIRINKATETKRFSIARHGEQQALAMAVAARKEMVRRFEGVVVFSPEASKIIFT